MAVTVVVMMIITLEVDPATAVSVDVSDHIVDVRLRQIVTQLLQDPPVQQ